MNEKSEIKVGLIVTIAGILLTACLGVAGWWASWVSLTLYDQNGKLSTLTATVADSNQTSHEVLNLLSGKDTIPLSQLSAMSN